MRIMINGMWKRCELLGMSCAASGKHPRTAPLAPASQGCFQVWDWSRSYPFRDFRFTTDPSWRINSR